jgi:hypothetical protein
VTDGFFQYRLANGDFGAAGALLPETITISRVVTGVPEPSTWVMMLIGFAGLGHAARRRRQPA